MVFVAFQMTFAIITPALITGATAERWKFGAFLAFVAAWSSWSTPRSRTGCSTATAFSTPRMQPGKFFAQDFAGGTVVHINAGAAGLAMALVLGQRHGSARSTARHNIPFILLGAGLLWFGWFGFNAGSALAANDLASYAWVTTNTATAAAMLGWLVGGEAA